MIQTKHLEDGVRIGQGSSRTAACYDVAVNGVNVRCVCSACHLVLKARIACCLLAFKQSKTAKYEGSGTDGAVFLACFGVLY